MWVRSQDKYYLVDVKNFSIVGGYSYGDYYSYSNKERKYEIVGISEDGKQWSLGVYNTKEKVMYVLDELQIKIAKSETEVYKMPYE